MSKLTYLMIISSISLNSLAFECPINKSPFEGFKMKDITAYELPSNSRIKLSKDDIGDPSKIIVTGCDDTRFIIDISGRKYIVDQTQFLLKREFKPKAKIVCIPGNLPSNHMEATVMGVDDCE